MANKRFISDLRRKSKKIYPKKRMIIICEGSNTEPKYFSLIGREINSVILDMEFVPGAGVPLTVAKKAVSRARNMRSNGERKNSFEREDTVWAIFDRDEHPCFFEATLLCESNDVKVCASDPCFEVWLILHFEDFHKPVDRHAVQSHLERICPQYHKDKAKLFQCDNILERMKSAAKRAKIQEKRRIEEGLPIGRPYTRVYQLVDYISMNAH